MHFGKPLTHYLRLPPDLALVSGMVAEGARTRFWRDTTIVDLKGTVTAAPFSVMTAVSEKDSATTRGEVDC